MRKAIVRKNLGKRLAGVIGVLVMATAGLLATSSAAQATPWTNEGARAVSGGFFYLKNFSTGMCMDVETPSTAPNGDRVQQWDCRVTWNQQFQLVDIGIVNKVRAWRIKPRHDLGTCVDVTGGLSSPVGDRMQTWECSPGWQQMFQLEPVYDDGRFVKYRIRPVYNHRCLEADYQEPLGQTVWAVDCDPWMQRDLWYLAY